MRIDQTSSGIDVDRVNADWRRTTMPLRGGKTYVTVRLLGGGGRRLSQMSAGSMADSVAAGCQVNRDSVPVILADRPPDGRSDRQFVGAITKGHERTLEGFAVNGARYLDKAARAEDGSRIRELHARPGVTFSNAQTLTSTLAREPRRDPTARQANTRRGSAIPHPTAFCGPSRECGRATVRQSGRVQIPENRGIGH